MHFSRAHRYLLSISTGLLLTLSFPFTGSLTPLAFVAWIPLLLIEDQIHRSSYRPRKLFLHAYISFLIYNLGTTWWVYYASAEGAYMAFILNSLIMASAFQLFHFTKRNVGKKEGYLSLIIYWIAFEYFHYNWESSWPWLTLGNVFSIRPAWVQWYDHTGVLGGSLWILCLNLILFKIIRNIIVLKETIRIQTPLFYVSGILLLAPLTISFVQYFSFEEKLNPIEVTAIQPNIDPYNEKFHSDVFGQLDKLLLLGTRKITEQTDLIVAPETAISLSFDEDGLNSPMNFSEAVKEYFKSREKYFKGKPICIGASTHRYFDSKNSFASQQIESNRYIEHYNTSVLINSGNFSFIHKSKLVPGVEKIPFAKTFPFLEDMSIDLGGTTGTLGIEAEPQIFETSKAKFAPVICYESAFGEFVSQQCRKGAELICIITNDGWWHDTPGYKQHASFASLRAIENRRSVVRAANTGISCFVDQKGNILQATDWWVPAVISGTVNLNSELSFYTIYGDVLGRSLSFVAVLLVLFSLVRKFKNYFSKNDSPKT
jgi:apolipoprotein N-acyltransferase